MIMYNPKVTPMQVSTVMKTLQKLVILHVCKSIQIPLNFKKLISKTAHTLLYEK